LYFNVTLRLKIFSKETLSVQSTSAQLAGQYRKKVFCGFIFVGVWWVGSFLCRRYPISGSCLSPTAAYHVVELEDVRYPRRDDLQGHHPEIGWCLSFRHFILLAGRTGRSENPVREF
jgi:hypothetical protein